MNTIEIQKLISDKVDGVWIAEHDITGHHYRNTQTGQLVDSVTTKIIIEKEHLIRWAVKKGIEWLEVGRRWEYLQMEDMRQEYITGASTAYTEIRDDAGSIGTVAHDAIEDYLKAWLKAGEQPEDIRTFFKPDADSRSVASARAAEKVMTKRNIIPIATELLVGSERYGCAGTLDFLCIVDGQVELWDWKTSNHMSDDYAMQVSAYWAFFHEMTGIRAKTVRIMHLSKDSDRFTSYIVPNLPSAYKAFKGLSTAYDWLHNNKPKLKKDIKSKKIKL